VRVCHATSSHDALPQLDSASAIRSSLSALLSCDNVQPVTRLINWDLHNETIRAWFERIALPELGRGTFLDHRRESRDFLPKLSSHQVKPEG
jgi:hypothetical protein